MSTDPGEPQLDHFSVYNTRVHGITADSVANQPTFAERVPDLLGRLESGLPIVAHNTSFDINVLDQALAACGHIRPDFKHHCTKAWSKSLLQLPNYKLTTVCTYLGITVENHHEAGSDALSAAQIVLRLAETVGVASIDALDAAARRSSYR